MKSNVFIDSNICIYGFGHNNVEKQIKSLELINSVPVISSQVVIETSNVLRRKLRIPDAVADDFIRLMNDNCSLICVDSPCITSALSLRAKHGFSFLDSMIVAAALSAGCEILYSEDMHHGQMIDGALQIVNPYLA